MCEKYAPPFLTVLFSIDSTHPTSTYTEAHTRTHRNTFGGFHKQVPLRLLLRRNKQHIIEGRTLGLIMVYGEREESRTKPKVYCERGADF